MTGGLEGTAMEEGRGAETRPVGAGLAERGGGHVGREREAGPGARREGGRGARMGAAAA